MNDKQAMFDVAMYLLAISDEGMSTKMLHEALTKINNLIYVRENIPF